MIRRERGHYRRAVQFPLARRVLGDVGQPQGIGPLSGEVPPAQVFLGRRVHQVLPASHAVDALDAGLPHEPLDPLAVHLDA